MIKTSLKGNHLHMIPTDFFRILSWPIVYILGKQRVITPNHITLSVLFIRIYIFILILNKSVSNNNLLISSLLFFSVFLDSIDGQLARIQNKCSTNGALLDLNTDFFSMLIILFSLLTYTSTNIQIGITFLGVIAFYINCTISSYIEQISIKKINEPSQKGYKETFILGPISDKENQVKIIYKIHRFLFNCGWSITARLSLYLLPNRIKPSPALLRLVNCAEIGIQVSILSLCFLGFFSYTGFFIYQTILCISLSLYLNVRK